MIPGCIDGCGSRLNGLAPPPCYTEAEQTCAQQSPGSRFRNANWTAAVNCHHYIIDTPELVAKVIAVEITVQPENRKMPFTVTTLAGGHPLGRKCE